MVVQKALEAPTLSTIFKWFCKDAARNVLVILDNLNVHKAGAFKAWLADYAALIEVFYLPS